MTTFLAIAVAIGFTWSTFLFFAAVFIRERPQELGFQWALGGAALFFVTFGDRLPGDWTWMREALARLPGVSAEQALFSSSVLALVGLTVLYALRVGIFYRLFMRWIPGESEDIVNDRVAQDLSYTCFAICLGALLTGALGLGPIVGFLVTALLVVESYFPVLTRLVRRMQDLVTVAKLLARLAQLLLKQFTYGAIFVIARLDDLRRAARGSRVGGWLEARLAGVNTNLSTVDEKNKLRLEETAKRLSSRNKSGETR